ELQRSLGRFLASLDPLSRIIARRSRLAMATTEQTARRMTKLGASQVKVHPMIGLTERELQHFGTFPTRNAEPFRLISMGRLIHWKGFHLALRAFARLHSAHPASEYWIAGSGPESGRLKALARKLG